MGSWIWAALDILVQVVVIVCLILLYKGVIPMNSWWNEKQQAFIRRRMPKLIWVCAILFLLGNVCHLISVFC